MLYEGDTQYIDKKTGEIIRVVKVRDPKGDWQRRRTQQQFIRDVVILGVCMLLALGLVATTGSYKP